MLPCRQEGSDFNTIANYAASAIKVMSLLFSVVGGGGGGGSGGQSAGVSDRIDAGTVAGAGGAAVRSRSRRCYLLIVVVVVVCVFVAAAVVVCSCCCCSCYCCSCYCCSCYCCSCCSHCLSAIYWWLKSKFNIIVTIIALLLNLKRFEHKRHYVLL